MQLPQTPDSLVVVGTAAVVIGVLILLVHFLRRRMLRSRRHERTGPSVADWTGGAALYGVGPWPDPAGATSPVDETRADVPPAPSGASESEGEERGAVDESEDASAAPWLAAGPDAAPSPELVAAAVSLVASGQPAPVADPLIRGAHVPGEQAGSSRTVAAAVAQAFAMRAAASRGATARPLGRGGRLRTPPVPPAPRRGTPYEPLLPPPAEEDAAAAENEQPTPSEPVRQYVPSAPSHASDDQSPPSARVEEGSVEDTVPITPAHEPASEDRPGSPVDTVSTRGDARDRLLAVLLADPARAVDATEELVACLIRLAELSDAMRRERGVLRAVLLRLAAAGLSPEQSARLAGMPVADVRELLAAASS